MATHTADIIIHAPALKVFEALTNPGLIARWQHGLKVHTNWEPGQPITFSTTGTRNFPEQWGTVLEVRPAELIRYNLFTPRPDMEDKIGNYNVTTYVLAAHGNQTKVSIIQEDNRPSGFTPLTLKPILVALKKIAEADNV